MFLLLIFLFTKGFVLFVCLFVCFFFFSFFFLYMFMYIILIWEAVVLNPG